MLTVQLISQLTEQFAALRAASSSCHAVPGPILVVLRVEWSPPSTPGFKRIQKGREGNHDWYEVLLHINCRRR